jgi:hypothetical protein
MTDVIDLQDFLSSKKIMHSDTSTNFNDAIMFLVKNEKNADIITYNYTKQLLFDTNLLEIDREGHYFYEYRPDKIGDIIDNIRFESSNLNNQLTYYIGGIKYAPEEVSEFVFISALFHEFKIRITFLEKPSPNDKFKILSRYYLINSKNRGLLQSSRVITKNNIYNYGMYIKLNNFEN